MISFKLIFFFLFLGVGGVILINVILYFSHYS